MNRYSCLFAVSILILAVACSRRPKDILSEEETIEILSDLQLAEAYINSSEPGARSLSSDEITRRVLEEHKVSQADLDSTIAYYGKNIDEYYLLFDKVAKRIQERQGRAGIVSSEMKEENNIWPYSPFLYFSKGNESQGLTFTMTGDELERGDLLEWNFRVSAPQNSEAILGVEYGDGTSSLTKKTVNGDKRYKLTFQTDTGRDVIRIFGIYNLYNPSPAFWADSIRLMRSPLDTLTYSQHYSQKTFRRPVRKPLEETKDSAYSDSLMTK